MCWRAYTVPLIAGMSSHIPTKVALALATAGGVGGGTALIHGILLQRIVVRPIGALFAADGGISAPMWRLATLLMHFTTFNWLLSGLALIAAAIWLDQHERLAIRLFAASSFLCGALSALWAVRRPHPSWILMATAIVLIILGLAPTLASAS